jgi:hypothetical protein
MNQDILIQNLENKDYFNSVIQDFPGLYSDCLMVKQKKSKKLTQTSVEKIINFYKTNQKFKKFIDNLNLTISKESIKEEVNDVAGLIIVIDKQENSYKQLMETAKKEKWVYKGLHIITEFDKLRLYFY